MGYHGLLILTKHGELIQSNYNPNFWLTQVIQSLQDYLEPQVLTLSCRKAFFP